MFIHFAISATVLLGFLVGVYGFWFPTPYATLAGVGSIIGLLALIQLLPFPALTALVYRPGKKSLKFDLAVIGLLQAVALAYGGWSLYSERPHVMVHALDRFSLLAAKDLDLSGAALPDKPLRGPLLVVATLPDDPAERSRLLEETLFGGRGDIDRRPEFWKSYADHWRNLLLKAEPLITLREQRPEAADRIDRLAQAESAGMPGLVYVPVIGKRRDFALVLRRADGTMVDVLAVNPWIF